MHLCAYFPGRNREILSKIRFMDGIAHREEIPKAPRQYRFLKWRSSGNAVGQHRNEQDGIMNNRCLRRVFCH